jgi:hypothetical protein
MIALLVLRPAGEREAWRLTFANSIQLLLYAGSGVFDHLGDLFGVRQHHHVA